MISKPIKICIVVISLGKGGLERTTAFLSRMLFEEGYNVHIVVLKNSIDYKYKGELFNLGLQKDGKDSAYARWRSFKTFKDYIDKNDFDYIIDTRSRREPIVELLYLFYVYRKFRTIYVVHSSKIENYFTKNRHIKALIIKKANKIVCVSQRIKEKIDENNCNRKTITIYNPIENFQQNEIHLNLPSKYILFIGRIDEKVKNLKLLIEAYKISNLQADSIKLLIVGDGPDKERIRTYIQQNDLEDFVIMKPFTPNIYDYLSKALFLTLTSHYEGFPMVLIESLSVGTPVVSVDCESGPNEIIRNEYNGLLVENDNPQKFAKAMKRMTQDCELYSSCKSNAKESIQHLSQGEIIKQWKKILM